MPKAERPATTVPAGEEHLSKEREKYLAGLKELADLDGDYFQVSF